MSRPDVHVPRESDHAWHSALNDYSAPFADARRDTFGPPGPADADGKRFMYEAKRMAEEVPRLALLFGMERRHELPQVHHQCSRDHHGTDVPDNHLTCCLGVECRACPHLAAIDALPERFMRWERDAEGKATSMVTEPVPDEQRDAMKAWTCATHIVMRGGDSEGEGYVLRVDDRMYWDSLYRSLASGGANV